MMQPCISPVRGMNTAEKLRGKREFCVAMKSRNYAIRRTGMARGKTVFWLLFVSSASRPRTFLAQTLLYLRRCGAAIRADGMLRGRTPATLALEATVQIAFSTGEVSRATWAEASFHFTSSP